MVRLRSTQEAIVTSDEVLYYQANIYDPSISVWGIMKYNMVIINMCVLVDHLE